MTRKSKICPDGYVQHLMLGDTEEFFIQRIEAMSALRERHVKIIKLAEILWYKVATWPLDQLLSNGSSNNSPRMHIRHLHNLFVFKARRQHCHAALYRSAGAHALLQAGGLLIGGDAVVHCEHTIPTGPVLRQMHALHRAGQLPDPATLVAFFLGFAVVTAVLQTERRSNLNKKRIFDGFTSSWSDDHPEFLGVTIANDACRPFRRYVGTDLKVVFAVTGEPINLEHDTLADHRRRIAALPLYSVESYF